jgi:hypothetical protein
MGDAMDEMMEWMRGLQRKARGQRRAFATFSGVSATPRRNPAALILSLAFVARGRHNPFVRQVTQSVERH